MAKKQNTKTEMTKTEKLERHGRIIPILEKTKAIFDILLLGDDSIMSKWQQIQESGFFTPESHLLLNFCTLMLNMRVNTEQALYPNLDIAYHDIAEGIRNNEEQVAITLAKFTKVYQNMMKNVKM